MKTFYWLLKREFWEHRGGFLWAPVVTAAIVVAIDILLLIGDAVSGGRYLYGNGLGQHLVHGDPHQWKTFGALLDVMALMPTGIICIVLFFVLLSYCMKTLSADRADRSILFWKSLPVSDTATILSKVASAVVVAPVIAVIVGTIGYLLALLVLSLGATFHGIGFGQAMWTLTRPGHVVAALWATLPIYMVWMLPAVGWLMLCSAWAGGKVTRWAIAVPFGLAVVFSWFGFFGSAGDFSAWFWNKIALRIVLGILPGSWFWLDDQHGLGMSIRIHGDGSTWSMLGSRQLDPVEKLHYLVSAQYHLFLTPEFLWGILACAGMIAIAIWLRRWRTEL